VVVVSGDLRGVFGRRDKPFQASHQTKVKCIHDSLAGLVGNLSQGWLAVLVGGQPVKLYIPPYSQSYLFCWAPGTDLPMSTEDYVGTDVVKALTVAVVQIQHDEDSDQIERVASNAVKLLSKSKNPLFSTSRQFHPRSSTKC
jgi:hypothetical protein